MKIVLNWYETLVFDIQTLILYVIIPKLYHVTLLYVITMTCIYTTLCKKYYVIYTHIIAKYDIITLSYKMYAYCMFLMQNAFPPYPIVTNSLVSFQYEGQLSFV